MQAVSLKEEIDGKCEHDNVASEDSLMPTKVRNYSHLLYLLCGHPCFNTVKTEMQVEMQNKDDFSMFLALEETARVRTDSSCRSALQIIDWLEAALGDTKNVSFHKYIMIPLC